MENKHLEKMIEAAEAGGKIIKKYFGSTLEAIQKTIAADVQTKADLESEEAVLQVLEKSYPAYSIFSEEKGIVDKKSGYSFIIDPLDGTNNFTMGIAQVSVGIALIKDETILAGVIHNPITSLTYYAGRGEGSFLNGERIKVNTEANMERASVTMTVPYSTTPMEKADWVNRIYSLSPKRMMNNWSPLLDYGLLASGKTESHINIISNLFDFVPGKIIVKEAGGKITDFNGHESRDLDHHFVASNGTQIHDTVLSIVK